MNYPILTPRSIRCVPCNPLTRDWQPSDDRSRRRFKKGARRRPDTQTDDALLVAIPVSLVEMVATVLFAPLGSNIMFAPAFVFVTTLDPMCLWLSASTGNNWV